MKVFRRHNTVSLSVIAIFVVFAMGAMERVSFLPLIVWHTHHHDAHGAHHHAERHAAQPSNRHHSHAHGHAIPIVRRTYLHAPVLDYLISWTRTERLDAPSTSSVAPDFQASDTVSICSTGSEFFPLTKPPPLLSRLLFSAHSSRAPPSFPS